jgi:ParB-like chromosome segregation protein Spo0J
MYQKELASLRRFGMVAPLIVRRISPGTTAEAPPGTHRRPKAPSPTPPATPTFELVDGEHRLKGGKELGYKEVPIWDLGEIPDAVAKQLTIVLNETRGSPDPGKLGELLMDLLTTELPTDLLAVLPFPEERFTELTKLAEFDWSAVAEPKKTDTGWVERTYRLPKEAAEVIDSAIARVKDDSGSVKDWHALEYICADFLAK